MKDFSFAVCAYKDSPYLEDALHSASTQTIPVEIIVATSTPSKYIEQLAEKYHARYCVNPVRNGGIAADWNFALSCIETPYGAILHQDDVYLPQYAERVLAALQSDPESLIAFTDYGDLMSDGKIHANRFYLHVKRMLLWAFYLKPRHTSSFWKRSAVVWGNAICCPAVSYNLERLRPLTFDTEFSVNLDWAKWIELTKRDGSFSFVPQVLMGHRIADSMETAAAIADNRRYREDLRIMELIWGKRMAKFLMFFYKLAYSANCS